LDVARILAALEDARTVTQTYVEAAVRLVLSPLATRVPAEKEENAEPAEQAPPPDPETPNSPNEDPNNERSHVLPNDFEILLSAALSAIPHGLLEKLQHLSQKSQSTFSNGKAGAQQKSQQRGRPCGVQRGDVRNGQILNLIETLRAAAPLQTLRRKMLNSSLQAAKKRTLIDVRKEDFRISHFKKRKNSTTIFVVDASGSSALHRLAEVKGAIEMILSECYIRRDHVALIAFRGTTAEMLLPPTRSLTRAQRSVAALPGGGGTPLATAIETATLLATSEKQKGISPTIVLLTDGKANIDRNGKAGRKTAIPDAICASQSLRTLRIPILLIDTSPRANKEAMDIASSMGARYIPLPHADSSQVAKAVFTTQHGTKERLG
ncbi:MAG: VWA domain-containing protein, partial [Hyphomicrobium sp.]